MRREYLIVNPGGNRVERGASVRPGTRRASDPAALAAALAGIPTTLERPASEETCGDADDVFFDARRARIYVSCGAGEIAVLEHANAGWSALTSIRTASGGGGEGGGVARTSLFVPELDRLFVAERADLLGSEAAIRVYRPAS